MCRYMVMNDVLMKKIMKISKYQNENLHYFPVY